MNKDFTNFLRNKFVLPKLKIDYGKEEVTQDQTEVKEEEWVWVTGYKGTEKDMSCRGYQFELGFQYDVEDDEVVETCKSGFHLCLKLNDVFNYYGIGQGCRFFEVRALVRKDEADKYGTWFSDMGMWGLGSRLDKLAAKSIEFVRELSVDEILQNQGVDDWSMEDKLKALEIGIDGARKLRLKDDLVKVGYSETFAQWLIEKDKARVALAVGSQPDFSMDMKVWTIMNN